MWLDWLQISKMMKKLTYILALTMMLTPLIACKAQTSSSETGTALVAGHHWEEGAAAVSAIINAYRGSFPGKFDALVSEEFAPNRFELTNRVEQASTEKTILNFDFSIDQSIMKGDRLAVIFDWTRTFIPKGSAAQTKDSGTTNFVFAKEAGIWRLVRMSGADIF